MRLALLGAFPFPVPQGSQVYFAEQARALARAGADVTAVTYGSGLGEAPPDLALVRTPAWLGPRRTAAGPAAAKPLADAALLARWIGLARRHRFDAVLAHNAEAALVALAARRLTGVRVVYVAHTVMRFELPSYRGPRISPSIEPTLASAGAWLDRRLAAGSDAVLALSEAGAKELGHHARGPVEVIPPGLDPEPPPAADAIEAACAQAGVARGRFALYAGNLDGYQRLDLLARAAALAGVPVVVATHASDRAPHPLRTLRWSDPARVRALLHGAGAAVLTRSAPGGFPVKLLNYMEAGRAIVARRGVAATLEHEHSAWLLDADAGPAEIGRALAALLADPSRAAALGRGARRALEDRHAWPGIARRTLSLAERCAA